MEQVNTPQVPGFGAAQFATEIAFLATLMAMLATVVAMVTVPLAPQIEAAPVLVQSIQAQRSIIHVSLPSVEVVGRRVTTAGEPATAKLGGANFQASATGALHLGNQVVDPVKLTQ